MTLTTSHRDSFKSIAILRGPLAKPLFKIVMGHGKKN
jgi:hypothetical protein